MPDALAMGWASISPPQREDTRPVSLIHSSCLQSSRSAQDHPLSSQLLSPNKPAATSKNTFQVLKRPLSVVPREEKKIFLLVCLLKCTFRSIKKGGKGEKAGHRVKPCVLVKHATTHPKERRKLKINFGPLVCVLPACNLLRRISTCTGLCLLMVTSVNLGV